MFLITFFSSVSKLEGLGLEKKAVLWWEEAGVREAVVLGAVDGFAVKIATTVVSCDVGVRGGAFSRHGTKAVAIATTCV